MTTLYNPTDHTTTGYKTTPNQMRHHIRVILFPVNTDKIDDSTRQERPNKARNTHGQHQHANSNTGFTLLHELQTNRVHDSTETAVENSCENYNESCG